MALSHNKAFNIEHTLKDACHVSCYGNHIFSYVSLHIHTLDAVCYH